MPTHYYKTTSSQQWSTAQLRKWYQTSWVNLFKGAYSESIVIPYWVSLRRRKPSIHVSIINRKTQTCKDPPTTHFYFYFYIYTYMSIIIHAYSSKECTCIRSVLEIIRARMEELPSYLRAPSIFMFHRYNSKIRYDPADVDMSHHVVQLTWKSGNSSTVKI